MLSIVDHNREVDVNFHVLTYDLSEENREYIKDLVCNEKVSVAFYDIDLKLFEGLPIGKGTANPTLSYATYLRLLIARVLPVNISKVIYLDCDIVVINSLGDLWDLNISDYYIAASSEYGIAATNGMKRLNIDQRYGYFNAGVLVLNLDKLRDFDFFEKSKKYVSEHFDAIKFHDQDVLNALLHNNRLELEPRWNMRGDTDDKKSYTVIHYMSKPWNLECKHPLKHLYYEYLNKTKWAGTEQTNAYTLWQKIKMKVAIRTRLQRMMRTLHR